MKNKVILAGYVLIAILVFIVTYSLTLPGVFVYNNTGSKIYVYSSESVNGIEPDPEEVDKIVRANPIIVEPDETIKLSTSFSSLVKTDGRMDVGWRTGGEYEYNSTGGGAQAFLFSSSTGRCSILIAVGEGFHNYSLKDGGKHFCYKKLAPFYDKYE